jgi:hypothetical protein
LYHRQQIHICHLQEGFSWSFSQKQTYQIPSVLKDLHQVNMAQQGKLEWGQMKLYHASNLTLSVPLWGATLKALIATGKLQALPMTLSQIKNWRKPQLDLALKLVQAYPIAPLYRLRFPPRLSTSREYALMSRLMLPPSYSGLMISAWAGRIMAVKQGSVARLTTEWDEHFLQFLLNHL